MRKSTSSIGLIVIFVVIFIVALVAWANTPNSTAGVQRLDGTTAKLSANETMILTHKSGKSRKVYEITYDGVNTVYFRCKSTICSDFGPAKLCGVGCTVDTKKGLWDHFYTTQQADDSVTVKWPWGWKFREY